MAMTHRILLAPLTAGIAAALVLAGTMDDAVDQKKYLNYASGFAPYTARLLVPCESKTCEASATLIDDHWAITAAHVVEGATTATLKVGGKSWPVDKIVTHPEFEPGRLGLHDVCLLHSEDSFDLDYYPELSTGGEKDGDIVSIAGYGVHGRMSVGHTEADGRLRAGTNKIDRIDDHLIICTASPGGSVLEYCIAPGDSGGPLFCRGRLAGVNCLTMATRGPLKSKTGEESGHVRVAEYVEWIKEVMR